MDLESLKDFETLSRVRNFSRAADLRNVTQPAFSRRIRSLEEWVGAKLFDRGVQPVALTAGGERFRTFVDECLSRLEEGRLEARRLAGAAMPALRFAATHSLSLNFFPTWLSRLERLTSLGAVRLVSHSMKECEEALAADEVQFLLCHHHDSASSLLDSHRFESLTVATDCLVPVLAGQQSAAWQLPGKPTEPLPLLAYAPESGLHRILASTGVLKRGRVSTITVFTSHLAVLLLTMVREGRGIAWLPASIIQDDLQHGVLQRAGDVSWDVPVDVRLFRKRGMEDESGMSLWDSALLLNAQAAGDEARGGR